MRWRAGVHLWRRLKGCDAGAALVEFTIVAPLLLLLLAGFTEFGRAVYHHHVLQKAARDATRYLARVDVDDADNDGELDPITNSHPNWDEAINLLMYGTTDSTGADPLIAYWTPDPSETVSTSGDTTTVSGTSPSGQDYTIEVSGPTDTTVSLPGGGTMEVPVVALSVELQFRDIGLLSAMTAFFGNPIDSIPLAASHEQAYIGE